MTVDTHFQFFPERASVMAESVDHLYLYLVLVAASFTALIFTLVIVFAVKYRRRPGHLHAIQTETNLPLELAWMAIPLGLCMVMFFWGAKLYFGLHRPPSDALDVYVVAKQWMWKLQHAEGASEIGELHVPVGRPVRLTMTSQDAIHSFFVPAFRIKQDVLPNRYTTIWFQAIRVGEYHLFCAEYCGTNHAKMTGRIVVMPEAEYLAWLAGGVTQGSLAAGGHRLFLSLGCANCHTERSDARCPRLEGLFGTEVRLQDGSTIVADEAYLRERILDPRARPISGFQPIMPSFRGRVSEEDLIMLVAYVKSLGASDRRGRDNR
jgi:cytochrome c oxidase subunit 2